MTKPTKSINYAALVATALTANIKAVQGLSSKKEKVNKHITALVQSYSALSVSELKIKAAADFNDILAIVVDGTTTKDHFDIGEGEPVFNFTKWLKNNDRAGENVFNAMRKFLIKQLTIISLPDDGLAWQVPQIMDTQDNQLWTGAISITFRTLDKKHAEKIHQKKVADAKELLQTEGLETATKHMSKTSGITNAAIVEKFTNINKNGQLQLLKQIAKTLKMDRAEAMQVFELSAVENYTKSEEVA